MSFDLRSRHPEHRRGVWLRAAVIVLAGVVTYFNGLSGPFLLDDENSIVGNTSIRQLWPPNAALSPPRETPVAGRPLVNFTFALNYAASGLRVRSYHITNLAVHLLSALVLLGIIRRTLLLPKLERSFLAPGRGDAPLDNARGALSDSRRAETRSNSGTKKGFRASASQRPVQLQGPALNLSFACALVWALHPLNTEAVNYLSQRSELLMALFYLSTLYFAMRDRQITAVVCCAAGMACKESMVTAPVIVLLYDRVFRFDSLKDVFRARWRLYAGLAASWLVLIALMMGKPRTSAGFGSGADPWIYFLNQIDIIVHYLRLSLWPRALVIDYGFPQPLTIGAVVLPAVLLTALGVATLVALRYWPFVGFLGAWFFITLAPTSSFVPISTEVGAERRMYLPLVGVVVFVVIGLYRLFARYFFGRSQTTIRDRLSLAALGVLAVLLAFATFDRNREYQSRLSIAETNVARRPHGRSHFHLGAELIYAGQHDRALEEFRISARDYPGAHYALATEFAIAGRMADAEAHAREFIRLMPHDSAVGPARELLARALATEGQLDAAAEQLTLVVQQTPRNASAHVLLGDLRLAQKRVADAVTHYEAARALQPGDPEILGKLGRALAIAGKMKEAIDVFEQGVSVRPNDPVLLNMLGRALAADGRLAEATARFRSVVELRPGDAEAQRNLAMALAEQSAAR